MGKSFGIKKKNLYASFLNISQDIVIENGQKLHVLGTNSRPL
jgi:hypothetical protein